jgi:predicted GTPase
LTKRREALVYNTPDSHVTRDVREGVAKLGDMRFRVMDTAGLETDAESESVLARTAGITAAALRDCQIALFLIDGRFALFAKIFSCKVHMFAHLLNVLKNLCSL